MSTDAFVTGVIGLIGMVLTYIFSRGKEKADVTGTIANASAVTVETLLKTLEGLKASMDSSMDELKAANDLLKCEIDKLIEENVLLQTEIHELKVQNQELLAENIKLRKEIHKLSARLPK